MLIIDSGDIPVCSDGAPLYDILDAIHAKEHPFIQTRTKYYHILTNIIVCYGGACLDKETYIGIIERMILDVVAGANVDVGATTPTPTIMDPTLELKLIMYFTHNFDKYINLDIEADFTLKASEIKFNDHGMFDLAHLSEIRPELCVTKCEAMHNNDIADELSWRSYNNFKLYFRTVDTVFIHDMRGSRKIYYLQPSDAPEELVSFLTPRNYDWGNAIAIVPTRDIGVSHMKSALKC